MAKLLKFFKELNYSLIIFLALAVKCITFPSTIPDAILFLIGASLYAYFTYLDKTVTIQNDEDLKAEIEMVRNSVDMLKMNNLAKESRQTWKTKR
jgi:hypothetical protein